jgi:hemerythrin superfamily protein
LADLAEILMIEHLAIKKSKWIEEKTYENEAFVNFRSYVKECHIEVEEKVCFPIMEAYAFPDS